MKNIYYNNTYQNDLDKCLKNIEIIAKKLENKSILITGATGLIGSFIVDSLYKLVKDYNFNIKIYALSRNLERLKHRFIYDKENIITFIEKDVNDNLDIEENIDYIIHAASNAYPSIMYNDPVGTIMSNIKGTYNLLEFLRKQRGKRLLFLSSGEIYGEVSKNIDKFNEECLGRVDIPNIRSSYPLSKRCAENLCISYSKQFNIETVIARPCHIYGPNNSNKDNRATVQFINNAVNDEDIVLKSKGSQIRSYMYISDCVSALLTVLIKGSNKEIYNISNEKSIVSIADFAKYVSKIANVKLRYEINDNEKSLFSRAVLDNKRLKLLGWNPSYNIDKGIEHTFKISKWLISKNF
jgi:UDP-glucuronate decarboxylase